MLKLTMPRLAVSGIAAIFLSSSVWADVVIANPLDDSDATGVSEQQAMDTESGEEQNLALDGQPNKPPGGGRPGGGRPGGGGGRPGGGGGGGVKPPRPPGGGGGGGVKPPRPPGGGGGGGVKPPRPPGGGGGGVKPPRPPGGGGGGVVKPPRPPGGGGGVVKPPRPPGGGGGVVKPPRPPGGGGGVVKPPRPPGGGGGVKPPRPPGGGGGVKPPRPPGGGGGVVKPPRPPGGGTVRPPGSRPPAGQVGGVRPGRPIAVRPPDKVITHVRPSHLSRPVSKQNLYVSKTRIGGIHHQANVSVQLANYRANFHTRYNAHLQARYAACRPFYNNSNYRYYYSSWFRHGFCGGFYYPVRPWYGIENYFQYPVINWMYVENQSQQVPYYQTVYGTEYEQCPVATNDYARAYFPTDTMRDLGIEMSGLPASTQCNFRAAILRATQDLQTDISALIAASFEFNEYDIVVNHYENLQNQAVVLEGFVEQGEIKAAFKMVLDLVNPNDTVVFLPKDQEPTAAELNQLDDMNARIRNLGGDPNQVEAEPEVVDPTPDAELQEFMQFINR